MQTRFEPQPAAMLHGVASSIAPGVPVVPELPTVSTAPAAPATAEPTMHEDDAQLVAGLRAGDEAAFVVLVERYHPLLIRLAMGHVRTIPVAEEVVQDAWVGVLQGIDRFEGRSSLKTWICRITINQAKRRGERESRTIPFSALAGDDPDRDAGPSVDAERFLPAGDQWAGHWVSALPDWSISPEAGILSAELQDRIQAAIAALPPTQRQVITLRDVDGWSAPEVCNILALSETNQRVLLHRARSKVRAALERYFAIEAAATGA